MAEIDCQSWPEPMRTTCSQFQARISAYPDGQWVAEEAHCLAGLASAQRITTQYLNQHGSSYAALTDCGRLARSHDPNGEIYQLIAVAVAPAFRGRRLGRMLVDRQIEFARSLPGIRRIIGVTRPVGYHRHREWPVEEYVRARDQDGRIIDPVLAFHLEAGAQWIAIHSQFRPEDHQAGGYGILIEYPMP